MRCCVLAFVNALEAARATDSNRLRSSHRYNHNDRIIVANIGGTGSNPRYAVSNLRLKFARLGGVPPSGACQVLSSHCRGNGLGAATAHVRHLDGRRSQDWQLVWICAGCNNHYNNSAMPLKLTARLVPLEAVRRM